MKSAYVRGMKELKDLDVQLKLISKVWLCEFCDARVINVKFVNLDVSVPISDDQVPLKCRLTRFKQPTFL